MERTNTLPGVVTADEAAKYLRVSKTTLLRLAGKGLVFGVKVGRQWRFSRETIIRLVNHPDLYGGKQAYAIG